MIEKKIQLTKLFNYYSEIWNVHTVSLVQTINWVSGFNFQVDIKYKYMYYTHMYNHVYIHVYYVHVID